MTNLNSLKLLFKDEQSKVGYLHSVFLFWDTGEDGNFKYFADMVLSSCPYDPNNRKIVLKFIDVKNFNLNEVNGSLFVQVSIVDISANQMEDINFSVKEEENELFSFYCKSFVFE